jgi:AcrR family transcriptional regulator
MDMTTTADAASVDQDRKAPGRPRSARADEAIIEATLDLLASGTPVEALSIEAVATRAGVGKATIYRRWANKEKLIVDAVASIKGESAPVELGGSVREDLIALLLPTTQHPTGRFGKIMPCLVGELKRNPQLAREYSKVTEPRREMIRQTIRRGIATGQIRAGVDVEVAVTMLVAPLIMQNMMRFNPALEGVDLPAKLVDTLLAAAS